MNIAISGPPASGKGTQAEMLVDKFKLHHVSTGQILRNMQAKMPELKEIMNKGLIVPDDITMSALFKHLEERKIDDNFILDGSPRTIYQYEAILKWLKGKDRIIDCMIFLEIGKETAVERISSRRQDKTTGKFYNLITNPPPASIDPNNLIIRKDDKPDVVEERFEEYQKLTLPVIERAEKEGILMKVDGERAIEVIFEDIVKRLNKKFGKKGGKTK